MTLFRKSDKIYALLFCLYLIPRLPKDGFTYFVVLLPVKTLPFLVITGIARIPSVLSSTICGATLAQRQYWISGLIFAVTIALAVVGGLVYRAFLKKQQAKE